ncbi:hypothetical protein [Acinetobacter lwoffii]|uniref:hypothetical protein n=1 Tax=Acinetobacter lwoffii TaxID=28090 RepID=UPI0002CEF920|nr:hypothetical protein [Acinetobacter lwoffii]ENW27201.1 hypothetical protein F924_02227 [Acinetobacter lwoffii ATCC 9957 = CIP 70.31]
MNTCHKSLHTPYLAINNQTKYTLIYPEDDALLHHPLIERFGHPKQQIYIDQDNEHQPTIWPLYNGQLEVVQYAVMQDGEIIEFTSDGENRDSRLAKGFAMYGDFHHDKPIIITYSLEAFFKVAQTNYSVVLVVLPTLCSKRLIELKSHDFEQIRFVINQLFQASYKQLYLPIRPEQMQLDPFKKLEQNTAVRLINHYHDGYECDLSQYDETEQVQESISHAIASLS